MAYKTCMTAIQTLGAGATWVVQPPSYQSWRVTMIGSTVYAGFPPDATPEVDAALWDGSLGARFLLGGNLRGWHRRQNWMIDDLNCLRLTNRAAVPAVVSFSAQMHHYNGVGPSVVTSGLEHLGAGASVSIQPPSHQDWIIYDFGSEYWVGKIPNALPDLRVDLDDGRNTARIMSEHDARQWGQEQRLFVNRENYVTITNAGQSPGAVCWSAELFRYTGVGYSSVISQVQNVGALASVDFQPPEGQEWGVTMIGASRWTGFAPNGRPDITVSFYDGVNESTLQNAANERLNLQEFRLEIDHQRYLRITDASGLVGQSVGISAELLQMYASR